MNKLTKSQRLLQMQTKHLLIFGCGVMIVCLAVGYGLVMATTTTKLQRLVTFYDRGAEHSILTTADTVDGALKSAAIKVDPNDVIEPVVDTKLTKTSADIIIYRSRPIAIVDGAIRQSVMTASQSPNSILKAAGLKSLERKDKTELTRGDLMIDGAHAKLVVVRARVIKKPTEPKPKKISFKPKPNALTPSKGAQVYVDGDGVAHRETYYDLPMNVVIGACGPAGKYTIRSDGAKIDQDGYVLIAANYAAYPRCTVVDTSMGPGKVYDTGGFALRHPYGFDLATDWTNFDGR